ncbi:hypothetical protein Acr_11g0000130 [Actinidia rufa]|uniref:Uncharacterized protein n=1 Tax=Actinidia rufa TaxID=165716 RepID=A0A7J0FCS4_9ERIC|nr:hypothetical protein Acr_11g0000130 [Actinidia rufa]
MNRKTIGQIIQCIGHEHDEMSAHGLWTKLEEMYRKKTSQNKALMRRLVSKLQRGTTVVEQTSEFQRKGHKKRSKEEAREEVSRRRSQRSGKEVKEEIPTDDGGGQNPKHAKDLYGWRTTRQRVVSKGTVRFCMADRRSMKVTGVRHVSLRCKIRSDEALKLVEEHLEFPKKTEMLQEEGKLKGYTDWRGVSRQEELLFDIGPVVLARRMDEENNRCTEARIASTGIPEGCT